MAKTPSDKLFRLIQSLSPSEKRYFRIFIRGKTERDSKYLQLFEAMAVQGSFDEEKFKKKVYKNEPVLGKKYSELKAYLYDLILKCLQSFDEQQAIEFKIEQQLQGTAVLFKRGLYTDCREMLQKARKHAVRYECFTQLLSIIRWEKQLAYTQMDADYLHQNLERLHFEEESTLQKLNNAVLFNQTFFEMYAAIKRESLVRNKDRAQQLRALVDLPEFESIDEAISHKARVQQLRTLNLFYYSVLEYDKFYETGDQLIQLIESQAHFLTENISDYIAALSNQILASGLLKKYDIVMACLNELRELKPLTVDDKRKIHRQYFSNFFAFCTYSGAFEAGQKEMRQCQTEAAEFDPKEYETASFYYQYALISFGCGEYNEALQYLNEWNNQPRSVAREDLQSIARIFTLILHYESGHSVLLESLLRSATRFLKKKNRFQEIEQRFIQLFSELIRTPGGKEQILIFEKVWAELKSQRETPAINALLQTFDLEAWLEAKVTGQMFAAVVKKKWNESL